MSKQRARRNRLVRGSGPYHVESYSQNSAGFILLAIWPAFLEYGETWFIRRRKGEGGGPGIFTCMTLAEAIENFLNAPYPSEAVLAWRAVPKPDLTIRRKKRP